MTTDSSPTTVPRRRRRFGLLLFGVIILSVVELLALGLWATSPRWHPLWQRWQLDRQARSLARQLGDPSQRVRDDSAVALAKLGPSAAPALLDTLRDPRDEARALAVALLAEAAWEPEPVMPALIAATRDHSAMVRLAAVRAVARFDDRFDTHVERYRSQLVTAFRARLLDEQPEVRRAAVEEVRVLHRSVFEVLDELRILATDPDPFIRAGAASDLSIWLPPPESYAYLRQNLAGPAPEPYFTYAVRNFPESDTLRERLILRMLGAHLASSTREVRLRAIKALGLVAEDPIEPALAQRRARLVIDILARHLADADGLVRLEVSALLQQLAPRVAHPSADTLRELARHLANDDEQVRLWAEDILARLTPRGVGVSTLLGLLGVVIDPTNRPEVRRVALDWLRWRGVVEPGRGFDRLLNGWGDRTTFPPLPRRIAK
jgi:hypothetical protein